MSSEPQMCGSMMNMGQSTIPLSKPLMQLKDEHETLRRQMEAYHALAAQIGETAEAEVPAKFAELKQLVARFADDLETHSLKEESHLFPAMARYIGREVGPIAVMEYEHETAKKLLNSFLEAAAAVNGPLGWEAAAELAKTSIQAYETLSQHFFKEENVLFPMAQNLLSADELSRLECFVCSGEAGQTVTGSHKIGDIVAAYPKTADVFKQAGIDFCCGGNRPLAEVAREQGIDEADLLSRLNEACRPTPGSEVEKDWTAAPSSELIDHVVTTHHDYLRRELPVLAEYVAKIARVHAHHTELLRVNMLYQRMKVELEEHLPKEEERLFPLIKQYEAKEELSVLERALAQLEELEAEHSGVGDCLKEIRAITDGYMLPEDACRTYMLTFDKLQQLESDLFQHIHLENNILFPRIQLALQR